MAIYGKEKVRFTWTPSGDTSSINNDSLDWIIADKLLDGSSNDKIVNNSNIGDKQTMIYESKGSKHIQCVVDFDDGWGNIYQNMAQLDVVANEYNVPLLDFTWAPEHPTVKENTVFAQHNTDERNEANGTAYGRIDKVLVDYGVDGLYEETNLADGESFNNTFTTKSDNGIDIKMLVNYWNGWKIKNAEVIKHLVQTNIPPVSNYDRNDNGQCIPAYVWTATSTDDDDAVNELSYAWKLYKLDNKGTEDTADDEWVELNTGTGHEYTYPFQYEGKYKIVLRTTDDDGDWTEKTDEFDVLFDVCSVGGTDHMGTIMVDPNRWQMIAVPVNKTVEEYFCNRLATIANMAVGDMIEVCKAFPSADVGHGIYMLYKPGFTEFTDSGNFRLITQDSGKDEIVPFLLKTKNFGNDSIEFTWDKRDGD